MFSYSFIIPHKNIPSLLKRCLNSIPSRPDIEIIVVDDNSKAESKKELKKMSRDNLRIIFTTDNKGAGYARNIGVNNAHGKWVLFADADDFFLPKLLEKIDLYKDSNKKIILFKSCCRKSSQINEVGHRQDICNHISTQINDFQKGKISHTNLLLNTGVPWGKMVRFDFLKTNNIYFEEVRYSNDTGWITQIAIKTNFDDIFVSNEEIYCLTDRDDSLFYTRNKEAFFCRFNVHYRQHILLTRHNMSSPFNFCHFVDAARDFGITFLLKFYKTIFKEKYLIPPIYSFEKILHFDFPYCYLLVQFIKAILTSLFFFIPHRKNKINF